MFGRSGFSGKSKRQGRTPHPWWDSGLGAGIRDSKRQKDQKEKPRKKGRLALLREIALGEHKDKPEEEENVQPARTARKPWDRNRNRIPKSEKGVERPRPLSNPDVKSLTSIRARSRWRASTGYPALIHPLRPRHFLEEYLGKRAFLLRRGPLHPRPMERGRAMQLLHGQRTSQEVEVLRGDEPTRKGASQSRMSIAQRRKIAQGAPAMKAWERGMAVRFTKVGPRLHLGKAGDRFMKLLKRLAPGRPMSVDLYGAPNGSRLVWPHEDVHDQFIVQLFGSRRWTVCTRGWKNSNHSTSLSMPPVHHPPGGQCLSFVMRQTDVLYLPSYTWHWADAGRSDAMHVGIEFSPMVGFDLVRGLGASRALLPGLLEADAVKDYHMLPTGASELSKAAQLFAPLPLWLFTYAEDAAPAVSSFCNGLPWHAKEDVSKVCALIAVRVGLLRITGASGRRPRGNYTADRKRRGSANFTESRTGRAGMTKWLPKPVKQLLRFFSDFLFYGSGLALLLWLLFGVCSAASSDEEGPGRLGQPLSRRSKTVRSFNRQRGGKKSLKAE